MKKHSKDIEDELEDILQKMWRGFSDSLPDDIINETTRKVMNAEHALLALISTAENKARLDEVDNLRREFWRTTWTPYNPDSIFKDRIKELEEAGDE